ncbi:hypothetical protein NDU88_005539 [Pleurodeles waltl]|uniref:Secreted protein n=1 Tax=Pleurodeles waltl TaxID=8319 RepID=A0AAV7SM36_PLEWA|nr:hypothetical protein NDU88_005539 [Pleurodeles waltl]
MPRASVASPARVRWGPRSVFWIAAPAAALFSGRIVSFTVARPKAQDWVSVLVANNVQSFSSVSAFRNLACSLLRTRGHSKDRGSESVLPPSLVGAQNRKSLLITKDSQTHFFQME